jgi:hypothetical protein
VIIAEQTNIKKRIRKLQVQYTEKATNIPEAKRRTNTPKNNKNQVQMPESKPTFSQINGEPGQILKRQPFEGNQW